jgi:(p)ppGpp synthase/HD superfamily hydrolase
VATLEDAIALAALAHKGQQDKADAPYILHPIRVMLRVRSDEERMTAILHDVVEDSEHTLETLRELGYPEAVLEAVECVTKREGEDYDAFIERAATNAIARRVKIADLEDNLDLTRIKDPQERDHERMERYRKALARLTSE